MVPVSSSSVGIILTGATGYLGQHVLHSLLSDPLRLDDQTPLHVYAWYQSKVGLEEAVDHAWKTAWPTTTATLPLLTVSAVDITDESAVASCLGQIQERHTRFVCIHTAALSSPATCERDPPLAMLINRPTGLFDMLESRRIPILCLSTDQVYDGNHAPYACPSTGANSSSNLAEPCNVYGETKLAMEKYLQSRPDMEAICLRSSIILGPPAPFVTTHTTFLQFCQQQGSSGQATDYFTDEKRSVIAVWDVVAVLRRLVQQLLAQPRTTTRVSVYNMGGPQSTSRADMAHAVYRHFNFDSSTIRPCSKQEQPSSGGVPTPLDISMDSGPLVQLVSSEKPQRPFRTLEEIIQETFPNPSEQA
jgi:dTDP-4-dehydrorhamnose reductase